MNSELIVELMLDGQLVHKTTNQFWVGFHQLPNPIKKVCHKRLRLLYANPAHPSLEFKRLHKFREDIWSVRVTSTTPGYRAMAKRVSPGVYLWYWIGTHNAYDRLLK